MKKRIGLFFGGMGNEADISMKSALNIFENFDTQKYKLVFIYWHKNSRFYLLKNIGETVFVNKKNSLAIEKFSQYIDIALPITHGRYGEDGILQSIFESQKIKYCGSRILSSALCMDKATFKLYLASQNINQTKFEIIDKRNQNLSSIKKIKESIKKNFKLPLYVKPSNSGSSIGISKINDFKQLDLAVKKAFKHDEKVIIEEDLINLREIEVAVLGNKNLIISSPGELKPKNEFYDFDNKYSQGKTEVIIPARLEQKQIKEITELAEKIYRLCNCKGFARVDFFIANKKIYINEINTLPGFTEFSMYPLLMAKKGFAGKKLINKIIELAY